MLYNNKVTILDNKPIGAIAWLTRISNEIVNHEYTILLYTICMQHEQLTLFAWSIAIM